MPEGFVSFVEVKRAVSIEAVLRRYELFAGLTEKGANLVGSCPFCKAKSASLFQVNPAKNAWYCFGCKTGGNVLDFVAKREGVGVRSAALRLKDWFSLGSADEAPSAESSPAPAETPSLTEEALPRENPPLAFTLKTLDSNHVCLAVLGLQASTIEEYGLGYCTRGLLKGRVAIPIANRLGDLVAYGGLAVQGEEPRYLFPPNFHPALEVFNLHRLAGAGEGEDPVYLAPEIAGVLQLSEARVRRALGLFDGTLSLEQEEAIAGVLVGGEQLVLVGEGFSDRAVARLARYASLSWISAVAERRAAGEEAA